MPNHGNLWWNDKSIARVWWENEVVIKEVDFLETILESISVKDPWNKILESGINNKPSLLVSDSGNFRETPLIKFLKEAKIHLNKDEIGKVCLKYV